MISSLGHTPAVTSLYVKGHGNVCLCLDVVIVAGRLVRGGGKETGKFL